ncbi:hypothetical protein GCM10009836_10430 [Pseudonocardia ailaonensis]|uniref:DUF3558 domain-containing protein n=1 Tax=Pseudonocardia ailaonensis TaxID=367279 RepID=A0ABN2MQS0_9PSEU
MRGGRIGAVCAVFLAVCVLAGCSSSGTEQLAVPTFANSSSSASAAAPPKIGLPDDCAAFLAADDLGALLARPIGSTAVRTIMGVAEPSVDRVARVGCRYSASGPGGGGTLLDINLGRYSDAAAAQRQWKLNTNAERSDGQSRDLPVGTVPGVLIERRAETVLAVVYGVDTLTFVLQAGARAPGAPADRLVDLAQRVLPKDGISQPAPPPTTPAAPPPATGPAPSSPTGPPPVAAGP